MEKLNFSHPDYLPNSQERLEHICRIINGRPVAILAAGPSIKKLEERIEELRHADICYFGINDFFVQENHILKKINKNFSVLIEGGGDEEISLIYDKVVDYLNRNDDNFIISSLSNLQRFLPKYDQKIICPHGTVITDRTVPDNDRPLHFMFGNGLTWLIYLAVIGKASKIILFGADGYSKKDNEERYYRPQEYQQGPLEVLVNNTNKGFNPIIHLGLRNIYKTYRLKSIPVLNCSEVSFLTPFPKVSYNDGFDFLLGRKNAKEISDLRIPTASIIIPSDGDETKLQNTLKNITEQSYSNYEMTVIKKSSNFLDTMKNALSLSKGKYIFYCSAGDGYFDCDWINSCLEVLENRPQISLVYSTPENQFANPPWRKKMFLYYWLKRKNFFSPNMLCVRKSVLEKCLFPTDGTEKVDTEFESWLNFNLRFNIAGYLPAFIPKIVDSDQHINKDPKSLNAYKHRVNNYKNQLILKKVSHQFRDGDGNILPGKFYLSVFLLYELAKKIKIKLPPSLYYCLNITRRLTRKFYQK